MDTDAIPTKLSAPVTVSIALPWSIQEARARLEHKLGRNKRWETSGTSDRRIDGLLGDDGAVELRVWEADWRRRRKSWNVVFGGRLESSGEASTLRGTIAVADADNLRFLIRILRVAAVFPFVLAGVAIVVGLLSRSIQMNMVAFGIGIGAVASIGLSYLQRSGERAAAIDARWLLEKVAALE
jgi:hypothetical protein